MKKSIKSELDEKKIKSFVKRSLSILSAHVTNISNGNFPKMNIAFEMEEYKGHIINYIKGFNIEDKLKVCEIIFNELAFCDDLYTKNPLVLLPIYHTMGYVWGCTGRKNWKIAKDTYKELDEQHDFFKLHKKASDLLNSKDSMCVGII